MKTITLIAALHLWAHPLLGTAQETPAAPMPNVPAPQGAAVYFQAPRDGESVRSPFIIRFGLRGMGVAPAGVAQPNTGHHHLLIDTAAPADESLPLPANDQIRHFGLGQTEAEISLPPGQHTLQLVLGDWLHRPHQPPVKSEIITVTVE
jgi:hypothetical protein